MKHRYALHEALRIVCCNHPTRPAVQQVVSTAQGLARACLLYRRRTGHFVQSQHGLDLDDLAMDCVADLFARDATGCFPEVQAVFVDADWSEMDATDAMRRLRRAVFRATNDRLFASCKSADPSLSRLIRNLKRVVRTHEQYALATCNGQRWVVRAHAPRTTDVRLLPIEILEVHLTPHAAGQPTTAEWLGHAFDVLDARPDANAAYPVTRLARAIRASLSHVSPPAVPMHGQSTAPEPAVPQVAGLRAGEIRTVLQYSIRTTKRAKQHTYLQERDLSPALYTSYFAGIHTYLAAHYIPPGRPSLTHHDALAQHVDGLVRDTYRARHRNRFEYLLRCARETFLDNVRCLADPSLPRSPNENVTNQHMSQHESAAGRSV